MRSFACLCFLCVFSITCDIDADAQSDFDQLFGPQLKKVQSTSTTDDDLALAKDLLNLAGESTSEAKLLTVLCEHAFELGRKNTDGYGTAIDALKLLAENVPTQRIKAMDQQADLLVRLAARGTPDQKADAGPALVQIRLALGDANAEKSNWAEAASQYRQASAAARRFDTDSIALASSKLKGLFKLRTLTQRVASLEEKLLRDATDSKAAAELVEIYLVELNQPARAKALAPRLTDPALKTIATHAGDDPETVDEASSLVLAEWFATQSASKPLVTKARLLDQSIANYQRYLDVHKTSDLARKKAALNVARLEADRAKIDVAAIDRGPSGTGSSSTRIAPSRSKTPPPYLHKEGVSAIAYSPDGKVLATGEGKVIRLLDRRAMRELPALSGHSRSIWKMRFSPDSRMIAVGDGSKVKLWNWKDVQSQDLAIHKGSVSGVAFTSNSKVLASAAGTWKLTDIADVNDVKPVFTYDIPTAGGGSFVREMDMSSDGKTIAASIRQPSGGTVVRLFDPNSHTHRKGLSAQGPLAISPNGKLLATTTSKQTVILWNTATGEKLHELLGHIGDIRSVAFSPDNSLLASGSKDNTVKVWDLRTGKTRETHKGHTDEIRCVAFAPDGRELASGSSDKTVRFWSVK